MRVSAGAPVCAASVSTSHDRSAERSVVTCSAVCAAATRAAPEGAASAVSPVSDETGATYVGSNPAMSRDATTSSPVGAKADVICAAAWLHDAHDGSAGVVAISSVAAESRPARYVAPRPPPNSERTSKVGAPGRGITWRSAEANGDDARPADRPAPGALGAA